jgi:hypothetical protein
MFTNISGTDGTQQRITKGMQYDITVTMCNEAIGTADGRTGNYQTTTRFEAVDIITDTNAMSHDLSNLSDEERGAIWLS